MSQLRKDIEKILQALNIEDSSRDEILKRTGIKPTTLHGRLNFLLSRGDIETYDDPKDRRITKYRISTSQKQKVEAELKKFMAIQFIESIENPVYAEREILLKSGDKWYVADIWSVLDEKDREKEQKGVEQVADRWRKIFERTPKFLLPKSVPGKKWAVIIFGGKK